MGRLHLQLRIQLLSLSMFFFLGRHSYCHSQAEADPNCNYNYNNYSFVHEATTSAVESYYDYIIVGGGTAGCPLAATLSQNYTVLLLERGGSPYGNPNITELSDFGLALSDLSPDSPSQRFISVDGVINARARVLGGGTCLNAGFYSRAATAYVRGSGWDGQLVNESYRWVEDEVAFQPPVKQWQSGVRDALIEVGVTPYNGFTFDHINGTKIGGTIFDQQGRRHTAADLLKHADPTKLIVLLHATVQKVFFRESTAGRRPRARGVIYTDADGTTHRAYLRRGSRNEVILSAGALGSPQLMMLSGIGPKAHLQAHNITVVMDQPNVGQGMSDNPMNAIYVPSPVPVEVSLIQVVGITPFGTYIEAASGESFGNRDFGMFSPKIGQLSTLPPKQRTPEALAKAIESMAVLEPRAFQGGFILEKIDGPLSTGHLDLTTTDPNDNPSVTFNYFHHPEDLRRCVMGIQTIERIIDSRAFSQFKPDSLTLQNLLDLMTTFPVNLLPKHNNTSTDTEQYCKDTVMTIWHYHGGCQVGRVVDPDYRVMGVDALRIVDGSTFNYSPGTNPQATVMMLGRYVGLRMLSARLQIDNSDQMMT